ncbi:protein dopey-2 [Chanos chanos]|uniref:Protein dopey-2 n=1 Tax=Chanos chanos TaxID=29144 RepID=A0A6J2WA87_CHACN|nr:protein dopey-2 [Chanos chanos]
MMDPEEAELQNDYRYRSYAAVIEKALRNFESSTEWADLISSLGKLNKALQSNLKYSLLPRRLIIGKRLAQCLHPALPSGVHLKALETYEVIFKIIGTKWLAKDLFIYSSGLFPLLSHAAMSVKPALLTLYERYFLPLQRALLPSLQAFVMGLLPGLEEGLEVYDRTDALLLKLSMLVGQRVFYGALWGSVLVCPLIRLPASLFIITHFDRMASGREQRYMLGTDHRLVVKSICLSLQDCNVLVQRNMLEILLYFFPFVTCLDPEGGAVPITREEMITVVSAASLTLLRRDMSLNRRLYAWMLGTDIKGGMVAPDPNLSSTIEGHTAFYFNTYSRGLLLQALVNILKRENTEGDPESVMEYLKPFRIIISLLDKPEIGQVVLADVLLEVVRAFYSYCRETLGENMLNCSLSGHQLNIKIKENKSTSEIIKTFNMLVGAMGTQYLWNYMSACFLTCLSSPGDPDVTTPKTNCSVRPTVSELSTLIIFLLDVISMELYTEIQTQYLPQMLGLMLQGLRDHMTSISLSELTQGLRACFKVLSKIQMPVTYMDVGAELNDELTEARFQQLSQKGKNEKTEDEGTDQTDSNQDIHHDEAAVNGQAEQEAEPGEVLVPPLRSEDSGLGLSASPSEQHLHPTSGFPDDPSTKDSEKDDSWRRGGSMESMRTCMQDILTSLITRYLLQVVDPEREGQDGSCVPSQSALSERKRSSVSGRKESRELSIPLIKDRLAGFFTPNKLRPSDQDGAPMESQKGQQQGWIEGYVSRGKGEISEDCRQSFTAVCHLLLECTTFPIYLTEEESKQLYISLFSNTGETVSLPEWLRTFMALCCLCKDHQVQQVAISSLLELVNHSQSLALVIKDKFQRHSSSNMNPLSGQLQMVTLPPICPALLRAMEEQTDFYQRLAHGLWAQLDTERREHHISCVELFYRLHCLAPSAAICEDIICTALLHRDKMVRLEALHKFSLLWHLTREIQNNRSSSHKRSFDRSLFVVLQSLSSQDGSVSASGQSWLLRALSLSDVVRILEPVLLLLLDPKTQRTSIQTVKHNLSLGNLDVLTWRDKSSTKSTALRGHTMSLGNQQEESLATLFDREALWAELESTPNQCETPPDSRELSRSESEETEGEEEKEEEESEHTESADTSGAQLSTENSSSSSVLYLQTRPGGANEEELGVANGLHRTDSEQTQASDSLSSDEDDRQLEAMARSRRLKQRRERQEAVDSLFRHVLLYRQSYECERVLCGFSILETLLRNTAGPFIDALASTELDYSSTAHLNLIQNLLHRHRQAQEGNSFYGPLQSNTPPQSAHSPSSPSCPPPPPPQPSLLLELLVSLCLHFLCSFYPSYAGVPNRYLHGNREVQVKSVEVLTCVVTQLVNVAQTCSAGSVRLDTINRLLSNCKVQQYVLLSLSASMYACQKPARAGEMEKEEECAEEGEAHISEESLVNLGRCYPFVEHPLQLALLKLLQALIVLEHCVCAPPGNGSSHHQRPDTASEVSTATSSLAREWQSAQMFQQAIRAPRYVPNQPITAQGMFVAAAVQALCPQYGCAMHPAWVTLLSATLPYLGRSLGIITAPVLSQICQNLNELIKQHEHDGIKSTYSPNLRRENIAPDYPLTLLEGLTTITHFCLLEKKKPAGAFDAADIRNASNAILEELPRILNTMSLLWSVVRTSDSVHSNRPTPASVYFKNSQILRQKILEFLTPLVQHFGVQIMASVAAVWSSRRNRKRRAKNMILPIASDSQLTLVDLVKSVSTLSTHTVLQLIREVVKKPHQIKGDQKSALVDVPMLQFSYAYIQSLSAQGLQENMVSLLTLLRESVQLNLAPPGHFLLLGILNDMVNRLPNMDNKRDTKELQEVTVRVLEAVGVVAGSSLEQTSWLSRNLEVKPQPQISLQEEEEDPEDNDLYDSVDQGNAMVSSSAPSVFSVQALTLLAEVLAPLLDMVYRSDEKEKAVPLISRIMYYVFPYLKNHSGYNMRSFCASARLLSSLSGYAYTKRTWKKEVMELFMDPQFFTMESNCICHWKSIVDHLLTHEKTVFKDLMSMQSSSLKLFNSADQKPMLLKRQAFAVFSGETDQYHLYLPLIQERLTENLRACQAPSVAAQMFLMFRVLLLRISPHHLTSLWPIMVTELVRTFTRLEKALQDDKESSKKKGRGGHERNGLLMFPQADLDMYLSACKFLDIAVSFPPERMPLFQMYRWAFVPEVDVNSYSGPENTFLEGGEQECKPHIVKVLEGLRHHYGEMNGIVGESTSDRVEFPLLTHHSLASITQLAPFFQVLCSSFNGGDPPTQYPPVSSDRVLRRLEQVIEEEFLDGMDS